MATACQYFNNSFKLNSMIQNVRSECVSFAWSTRCERGRGRHRRPLGGLWHAFKHKFKIFYMKFLICLLLFYPIREVRGYLRIRIRHHHYGRWSTRLGAAGFVVTHWNKIYFYSIVYLKKKNYQIAEVGWIPKHLIVRYSLEFVAR